MSAYVPFIQVFMYFEIKYSQYSIIMRGSWIGNRGLCLFSFCESESANVSSLAASQVGPGGHGGQPHQFASTSTSNRKSTRGGGQLHSHQIFFSHNKRGNKKAGHSDLYNHSGEWDYEDLADDFGARVKFEKKVETMVLDSNINSYKTTTIEENHMESFILLHSNSVGILSAAGGTLLFMFLLWRCSKSRAIRDLCSRSCNKCCGGGGEREEIINVTTNNRPQQVVSFRDALNTLENGNNEIINANKRIQQSGNVEAPPSAPDIHMLQDEIARYQRLRKQLNDERRKLEEQQEGNGY